MSRRSGSGGFAPVLSQQSGVRPHFTLFEVAGRRECPDRNDRSPTAVELDDQVVRQALEFPQSIPGMVDPMLTIPPATAGAVLELALNQA